MSVITKARKSALALRINILSEYSSDWYLELSPIFDFRIELNYLYFSIKKIVFSTIIKLENFQISYRNKDPLDILSILFI